tara:strand:+ start:1641 stop:2180 length:540 start_codon:yes stop_codon:yes gene_type:complete
MACIQQTIWRVSMNEEEWTEAKDILFLHETGIPPEKIAKVKKISIERVREILGNVEVVVKRRNKMNVVQEVGNQNKWKDELPTEEILNHMVASLEAEDRHDGARTIPSRPINAVDRSDRLGEDRKITDRIEAGKVASKAPEPLKEVVEAAAIAQRERDRAEWEDAQSEVSKLLDDDLDL